MAATSRASWIQSGILTFLERFSMQLFGVGSFWFLIRTLSQHDMGIWVVFCTIFAILEVGRAGLIQNALVKFLATATEEEYTQISTASLLLNGALTLLIVLFLFSCSHFITAYYPADAATLNSMLHIYAFTTVALLPFQQCNFTQQANFDFRGVFASGFVKQGLFFVFVTIFFFTSWQIHLVQLAQFHVLTATVASIVSYIYGRKYMRFSRTISTKWLKILMQYGLFVFGTNLSAMLHKAIDKLMLGSLISPIAVALYETCIKITNLVEIPTFSIAAIVFPQSAKQAKSEGTEGIRILYEKSVGAILAVVIPAILVVLLMPEFIIWIIAGSEYLEAAPLLRLTILYGLFIPFANQFGTILDSIGKPHINFIFVVIGVFVNIGSNYFFITRFGVVGAAYGTLLTYILMFFVNQFVLYKMLGVKAWRAFYYIKFFYQEAFQLLQEKVFSKSKAVNL